MTTVFDEPIPARLDASVTTAAAMAAPAVPCVDFDRTVPRSLVHRAAVSEVFITDVHDAGEDVFHVGTQWPRDHGYYRTRSDDHDPMLLAESIRQAALAIAHRAFEVPRDWKFLIDSLSCRVLPDRLAVGSRPAEILLVVTCHDVQRTRRAPRGMRMTIDCYRGGEWIGSGDVSWSCVTASVYRRLRGERFGAAAAAAAMLPVPVAPGSVGRERDRDVTIGATTTPGTWPLRVVPAHAVLFDHPVDHVPGMALLEAARQAASLVVGDPDVLPVRMSITFDHFVEHDTPAAVSARAVPTARAVALGVDFTVDQGGRCAAHGSIDLVPAP